MNYFYLQINEILKKLVISLKTTKILVFKALAYLLHYYSTMEVRYEAHYYRLSVRIRLYGIRKEKYMKSNILIAVIVLFVIPAALFAQQNTIALVFNNSSSVNRHVVQHIYRGANYFGLSDKFATLNINENINPSDYKAVILLNTGIESGIDPVFNTFLNNTADKTNVILLSLYKGSRDYTVYELPASSSDTGVDTISAATRWSGNSSRKMHEEWLSALMDLIRSY